MKRTNISIRIVIIVSFISLMIITVSTIGYIIFSNWIASVDETVKKMAEDMNREIYQQIDSFIHVPVHINEGNRGLLEKGIVDINNEIEREMFFVEVLKSQREEYLYSFSYGSEEGEYYGARRNQKNEIEIMRNNAKTGGHSWYYSVSDDLKAEELVVDAGKFDPRTRAWYKAAKETKKLVFSPIYKHFVMNDLTVSVAVPIYDNNKKLMGVLGSHITLSRIDNYLKEIVKDRNAMVMIIEKDSGELISNSLGKNNFVTLEDGGIRRLTIKDIAGPSIVEALNIYNSTKERSLKIYDNGDKSHVNIVEYKKEGIEWQIITVISESMFISGVLKHLKTTFILTLIALILSIIVYLRLTNKFLKPIEDLIDTAEKLSAGDLTQRATRVRNDEIGRMATSFNNMADMIYSLVNNLEGKVKERTIKLEKAKNDLQESKEQLQLILDSTAEAIYGIDVDGNCTFCNASGLKILGYKHQDELLGKNMHFQIHHSYVDGTKMPVDECSIFNALKEGKGTHVEYDVFWRADGTSFNVEYYAYPQYKNGEIVGLVITFWDITERIKIEERVQYLSYHDALTGLYNRMYFEKELKRIDTKKNLPISIIFGDINGLKLTNDIFGHAAGDELIKTSAQILKKVCREEDIIARVGGDEFVILLPNTEAKDTVKIIERIKSEFSKKQIVAVKGSISMGYDTKTNIEQNIEKIMINAEDKMYKEKTLERKNTNSNLITTIMETLHNRSPLEKEHSRNVSEICQKIGQSMNMSEPEIRKLKDAGYLHDIGKIILDEETLNFEGELSKEDEKVKQQHITVGYRILNYFDETLELAEGVLNHHENWDGSGYPKGLKGNEIPKMARIISIAEVYDYMTNPLNKNAISKKEALEEIKKQAGRELDPEIVEIFLKMMEDE